MPRANGMPSTNGSVVINPPSDANFKQKRSGSRLVTDDRLDGKPPVRTLDENRIRAVSRHLGHGLRRIALNKYQRWRPNVHFMRGLVLAPFRDESAEEWGTRPEDG